MLPPTGARRSWSFRRQDRPGGNQTARRRVAPAPGPHGMQPRSGRISHCRCVTSLGQATRAGILIVANQLTLVLDQLGLVPSLKQVSRSPLAPWAPLGIGREKRLHSASEIRSVRLEQEMEAIAHVHEAQNLPPRARDGAFEAIKQPSAVVIVLDDVLPGIAPSHEMIDRAHEFNAKSSWDGKRLPSTTTAVKGKIKTTSEPLLSVAGSRAKLRGSDPGTKMRVGESFFSPPRIAWCLL